MEKRNTTLKLGHHLYHLAVDCEMSDFVSVSDYHIGIEYPKDTVCEDITSGASLSMCIVTECINIIENTVLICQHFDCLVKDKIVEDQYCK